MTTRKTPKSEKARKEKEGFNAKLKAIQSQAEEMKLYKERQIKEAKRIERELRKKGVDQRYIDQFLKNTKQTTKQKDNLEKFAQNIRKFQTLPGNKYRMTLKLPADNKKEYLKVLVNNLVQRNGYNTTIQVGERFVPVNSNFIEPQDLEFVEEYDLTSWNTVILNLYEASEITIRQQKRGRTVPAGAFFPYTNPTDIDLTRYDIYDTIEKNNYKTNCLIKAFEHVLDKTELNLLKSNVIKRNIPKKKLKDISNLLKITIKLQEEHTNRPVKYGNYIRSISLGLIKGHYFLNEKTDQRSQQNNMRLSSFTLIKNMLEDERFIPITYDDLSKTQHHKDLELELDVVNSDRFCKTTETKEKLKTYNNIYYADFETLTQDKHIAYMCCVSDGKTKRTFLGEDAGAQLLNYLPTNSLTYFHNLGYDSCFFIKYLEVRKIIKTGSMVKLVNGQWKKKTLYFKDSYAIIPEALSEFGEMFDLPMKKEILPYSLYTTHNVNKNFVNLQEALQHVKPQDKEEFLELAKPYCIKTCLAYPEDILFKHISYAQFYCERDTELLEKGLTLFKGWINQAFHLDVHQVVSLPSLAYKYFQQEGVFDNVMRISGQPRAFIQKCVKGGRVMTRDNEKYHVKAKINNFDAVSLYPSAMARLGLLKGNPKPLRSNQLNMNFLNKQDGYFIEINNIQINKDLHFPLQPQRVNGILNYQNTLTSQFVDKYQAEDLIQFQHATFDVVRGYYFNEGRNYKIQKVINHCFNERKKQKQLKNPIQQVYKLLMNAAYGKLIQKPITQDIKFSNTKTQHTKFVNYNHNHITEYHKVANDKYAYYLDKSINQHYNLAHCGSEVLSMSKRIMNEVMCLAEDYNLTIYYQDTDSMHILDKDIPTLVRAFETKYKRPLIGNDMGQFHSDFEDQAVSTESIFLGKKAYIDILDTGKIHMRLKGVSKECITDPLNTYKKLFNGQCISFDLAKYKPVFKRNKGFSISTVKSFIRNVKFLTSEEERALTNDLSQEDLPIPLSYDFEF